MQGKVYYWVTDFKNGRCIVPSNSNFHWWAFKATEKEYNEELTRIFGQFWENGHGKVIGSHKFETIKEMDLKYGIKNIR
jgi:hypothetical protein